MYVKILPSPPLAFGGDSTHTCTRGHTRSHTPADFRSLCPWMVPADRHLRSDARAVRLASARGSYRTIARCCRHRDARLQVGASRAFGNLRALGTPVATRGPSAPAARVGTLLPSASSRARGRNELARETMMRVDAVPQPASPAPKDSEDGAGMRDNRRGTEP